ncbi:MAG: porin family protein, partial [Mesorhizobium sp.]
RWRAQEPGNRSRWLQRRNTMLGWTAGVGTDIKITDNVFGRVEYRYTDFGDKDFDGIGKVKSTDNRVTFGVGMKF